MQENSRLFIKTNLLLPPKNNSLQFILLKNPIKASKSTIQKSL